MWLLVPSAHEAVGIELWPCRGRRYTNDQMRDVRCGVLFRHTSSFTVFVSEIFQAKCVWLWNEGRKDHAFCYFPLQSRPFAFARTWLWLHIFLRAWLDYCPWDRFQPARPWGELGRWWCVRLNEKTIILAYAFWRKVKVCSFHKEFVSEKNKKGCGFSWVNQVVSSYQRTL